MMAAPQQPMLRGGELRLDEFPAALQHLARGRHGEAHVPAADVDDLPTSPRCRRRTTVVLGLGSNLLIRDMACRTVILLLRPHERRRDR